MLFRSMIGDVANAALLPVKKGMPEETRKELDKYFHREEKVVKEEKAAKEEDTAKEEKAAEEKTEKEAKES